mgnify:CR=1 FL=1
MLRSELFEIIANGENSGVEFKRDDIRPEQLAKEVVAFANLLGGRVLLGVEDDGTLTGLQRANPQEWVLNVFRDKVHPQIIPFYEEVLLEDNTRIGVLTLTAGISKPYVVRHNNREEIYIRMGDRSELATREQQARLFQAGGLLHVEVLPVAGSSFRSLDLSRMEYYLRDIIRDPSIPMTDEEWIERLLGLGLMAEDGFGNRVCSIAGLLCFGISPRRFLGQAGIRLMVFDGLDKEYRAVFDTVLDGPLVGRWETVEAGQRILADEGIIEKFSTAIMPFVTEESNTVDQNMRREVSWLYPWEALREAIVNALAHRDWTRSVDIEVVCYADRLEVVSPGKLQNSMTISKMIAGQRSPRNTLAVEVLRDYGYVDSRSMGVRTKIIPLMRQYNHVDPTFEATDDYVRVVLPRQVHG